MQFFRKLQYHKRTKYFLYRNNMVYTNGNTAEMTVVSHKSA